MRGIDDTDREILRLLLEDSRRPFREIAEEVDLSAPAVSERVDRLGELGLIRRFTLDLDRNMLRKGQPILIRIECEPGAAAGLYDDLDALDMVEHVFRTTDDVLVSNGYTPDGDVGSQLAESLDLDRVREFDVKLLAESTWQPHVGTAELAVECVECGNSVTREGEQERVDGTLYHFCCPSCRESFLDRYEELKEGA